jgi:type VI secretion system secreted protein Hcp
MTRSLRVAGVFSAALLVAGSGFAAYDAYLKIPGAQGDSTNAMHPGMKGWTEVSSFSWGAANPATLRPGQSQGPGLLTIDTSSPKLMQMCASGKHFSRLVLDVQGRSYVLENVTVGPVAHPMNQKAREANPRPQESISLNFTKIEQEVAPLTPAMAKGSHAHVKW